MSSIDAAHHKRQAAWPRVLAWGLAWVLAVIAALGVFVAYLDPELMVALGNAVWSCF
jgi:glycerol uptake facilitator-like aquaporin